MILELYIDGVLVEKLENSKMHNYSINSGVRLLKSNYGLFKTNREWYILRYLSNGKFVELICDPHNAPEYITVKSVPNIKYKDRYLMMDYCGGKFNLKQVCIEEGILHKYRSVYWLVNNQKIEISEAIRRCKK